MAVEKTCWTCAYRGKVPGSCHLRCRFRWAGSGLEMPQGDPYGVKHGWFIFPLNYDPTWMVGECPAWSEVADPDKVIEEYNPLLEILAMLGSAGRL